MQKLLAFGKKRKNSHITKYHQVKQRRQQQSTIPKYGRFKKNTLITENTAGNFTL